MLNLPASAPLRATRTLMLLGLFAGCRGNEWERGESCQPACAEPSCRNLVSCQADADCAVGTLCASGACRPPKKIEAVGNTLIKGFASDALELTRGQQGVFSVEAPKVAVNVSCALFVGPPRFAGGSITNIDASVARYHVFPLDPSRTTASVLNLRLDALEPLPAAAACDRQGALSGVSPLVESLRLGCWALSLDRVVAASQLLPLDPSELPEYGVTLLDSCDQSSAPTDGSYCALSPQIGACKDHECSPLDPGAPVAPSAVTTATSDCDAANDGVACQLGSPGRGRCFAGNCLEHDATPPLVTGSCAELDSPWANCFPSPIGLVGTCFKGLCRRRCHDALDCSSGELCELPPSASYLGACRGPME